MISVVAWKCLLVLVITFLLTCVQISSLHLKHEARGRSLLQSPLSTDCSAAEPNSSSSIINYSYIHSCISGNNPLLSIPLLSLLLLLHFYLLIETAQSHFSPVVTLLATRLDLSPSLGAVTLLALGNGAPDVFASITAVRTGRARTGFGAILSAGAFVSAFVVGVVAIFCAPFTLDAAPFVRDVFFYIISASGLFYVYLSAEIYLWQAVGFVAFYLFFVGVVVWMDIGPREEMKANDTEKGPIIAETFNISETLEVDVKAKPHGLAYRTLRKMSRLWEVPVAVLLKLTIPSVVPSEWRRLYASANIICCPIALLYSLDSFLSFNHPITFLVPNTQIPLWSILLVASAPLAVLHYVIEEPAKVELLLTTIMAFITSVFWISLVANDLMECLSLIGSILKLPPHLLGLTVLAWGNSVGDLVADVAVAKAGKPAMALAGCFAGPMFNMLIGMGTALVLQAADAYPEAYKLRFNIGIVVGFIFLLLSLMGSLFVVSCYGFRMPRFWGFCLVGIYAIFIAISLLVAEFLG